MNDLKTLRFLFRISLILHASTFFIFDSFFGPAMAFSLATLALFPGWIGKVTENVLGPLAFILTLLGKLAISVVLTLFYFLFLTPLALFRKRPSSKAQRVSSTLVSCKREMGPDFFHRQW